MTTTAPIPAETPTDEHANCSHLPRSTMPSQANMDAEGAETPKTFWHKLRGRRATITALLVVILIAWAINIAVAVIAPDAQGRTVAAIKALGGHSHELGAGVTDGTMPLWLALVLVVGSWIVMTTAMMLPSSIPMINLFLSTIDKLPNWKRTFRFFLAGYFAVWISFGLAAFVFDLGLKWAASEWAWLANNWQVVISFALATGAVWQLTPLKDACLKACRHPVVFLLGHYRRGGSGGWNLGVRHGIFCVGCCWALMLVMVVSGSANLGLMGVLGLIMLAEKAGDFGEKIVRPIGLAFAIAAIAVLFMGVGAHVHTV